MNNPLVNNPLVHPFREPLNFNHNWSFTPEIIKQRIDERNLFLEELAENNKDFEVLRKRESQKAKNLIGLLNTLEIVLIDLNDKRSLNFSDKTYLYYTHLTLYIKKYLLFLNPPLKFEASDDSHKHIIDCGNCEYDLKRCAQLYENMIPVPEIEDDEYIELQFINIDIEVVQSFVDFTKEKYMSWPEKYKSQPMNID